MAHAQSPVSPERTPERLCELNADALAAVLLDAAGALAGCTEPDREKAERMAGLARQLFRAVDSTALPEPAEQVEAQVAGGAVFASRTPRWTLAVVARRAALSSLMLYDLRAVLHELDGGDPIVVRTAAV